MPRDTYDLFSPPERGRFGEEDKPQRTKLIDLAMVWHRETEQAALLSDTGESSRARWLPLSLIEIEFTGPPRRNDKGHTIRACVITLPEWKAKQEGLI